MGENDLTVSTTERCRNRGDESIESPSRRDLLMGLGGAGLFVSGGCLSNFGQGETQTVSTEFTTESIAVGATTTVSIVLSEAPTGLAGYTLTVRVSDPTVGSITGVDYPDEFGVTNIDDAGPSTTDDGDTSATDDGDTSATDDGESPITDDGSTVELKATDVSNEIVDGDADVALATIELTGESDGTLSLEYEDDQFDDDDGERISVETESDQLTVGGTS